MRRLVVALKSDDESPHSKHPLSRTNLIRAAHVTPVRPCESVGLAQRLCRHVKKVVSQKSYDDLDQSPATRLAQHGRCRMIVLELRHAEVDWE